MRRKYENEESSYSVGRRKNSRAAKPAAYAKANTSANNVNNNTSNSANETLFATQQLIESSGYLIDSPYSNCSNDAVQVAVANSAEQLSDMDGFKLLGSVEQDYTQFQSNIGMGANANQSVKIAYSDVSLLCFLLFINGVDKMYASTIFLQKWNVPDKYIVTSCQFSLENCFFDSMVVICTQVFLLLLNNLNLVLFYEIF